MPWTSPVKGKYALIFEEEYRKAMALPRYQTLLKYQPHVDFHALASEVHNGYFSIDKKKIFYDTQENNQTNRDNAARAYEWIMRDKEALLSFGEDAVNRLKFIFSHSALREGWDNPNVFQICALRDIGTERDRRQAIGRGLRLCVNQQGERQRGFDVNTLTVVATESYEQFAENLQKEIEVDTGIRFGLVEEHQFAGISTTSPDGSNVPLGIEASTRIWAYLRTSEYIDGKGKVQDSLRTALKTDSLELPVEFLGCAEAIKNTLRKLAGRLDIKNADERKVIQTRQALLHSAEFTALWERVKHRTTYRLAFDNDKLVQDCIVALRDAPIVSKARVRVTKADINIDKGGVAATQTSAAPAVILEEHDIFLPDILGYLQDKTQLTRRSLANILVKSERLDDFKRNPQQFAELTTEVINRRKRMVLVEGIRYQRIGDEVYYAQELFEQEELTGYLKNMLAAQKSVHKYVVYDSTVEQTFAHDLELNEAVKIYAKLPGWFTVPTPLGAYNPDWAMLVEEDGKERLYFVVETKSPQAALLQEDALRGNEYAKILCGKAHFVALADGREKQNPAKYIVTSSVADMLAASAAQVDITTDEIPFDDPPEDQVFPMDGNETWADWCIPCSIRHMPGRPFVDHFEAAWFGTHPDLCIDLLSYQRADEFKRLLTQSKAFQGCDNSQRIRKELLQDSVLRKGVNVSGYICTIAPNISLRHENGLAPLIPYLFEALDAFRDIVNNHTMSQRIRHITPQKKQDILERCQELIAA